MFWPLMLLALPITEIVIFIYIAQCLGGMAVLSQMLATICLGVLVLQRGSGIQALNVNQQAINDSVSIADMVSRLLQAFGGLLLIIPGVITDVLGLMCAIPSLNRLFFSRGQRYVDSVLRRRGSHADQHEVIDGEWEAVEPETIKQLLNKDRHDD